MWSRLRRRTLAPRRPAVFPHQWPLAVLSVAAIIGGVAFALWVVYH
jgi:hypothetical protein